MLQALPSAVLSKTLFTATNQFIRYLSISMFQRRTNFFLSTRALVLMVSPGGQF